MTDMLVFFRRVDSLKARAEKFRSKTDYDTVKAVSIIMALINRADALERGKDTSDTWGFNCHRYSSTEEMLDQAEEFLAALENGEEPMRGYLIEIGGSIADHTFIEKDGELHIVYSRFTACYSWQEKDANVLGHAVTTDMVNWKVLEPVLATTKGDFDEYQVWAPAVLEKDGEYWMFYTGVNKNVCQAICLAKSKDLCNWEKYGTKPLLKSGEWGLWNEDVWSDCRDCFIFLDDDGTYIMYYCARQRFDDNTERGVTGIASSKDLLHWEDKGSIAHPNCEGAIESPFITKHNGLYYLFYTNTSINNHGTSYAYSDNPYTGWKYPEEDLLIPGVSCSEVVSYKGKNYISVSTNQINQLHFIDFYEFFWNDDGTVSVGKFIK